MPSRANIDACSRLILLLPASTLKGHWPALPYADDLKRRSKDLGITQTNKSFVTALPNRAATLVAGAALKTGSDAFELLTLARSLAAGVGVGTPKRIMVCAAGLKAPQAQAAVEATVAALLAAAVRLPSYKKDATPSTLQRIDIHGLDAELDLSRTLAEAHGNALARQLTALPSNVLTPDAYRKLALQLAKTENWQARFYDTAALKKAGAGAFLAVAQGSPTADAGILHLRYVPRRAGRDALALVGKGICFDTGGTNLKSAKYMQGMHEDMEGSAVALGTLLALSRMQVDYPVDCWLALAQNHIGPKAYKPNDVVTASNDTSIEIIHTDAEGRMVLADTLAIAAKRKPSLMIDYATLTGSCVGALSTRYSGALTNRDAFVPHLIEAGRASGERVWPFPNDADFDEALDSNIADVKQCTLDSEADHILAMRFLNRFVPKSVPWIHVDLSAGNHKGGLAHIPTDVTGFGVRYTLALLQRLK